MLAGSITFYAHLFGNIDRQYDYDSYCRQHNANQQFRYASWNRIKRQLVSWGIDRNFLYVTDASKVYKENSLMSFDRHLSKELLTKEIQFCKPDLLILLGGAPLKLLSNDYLYSKAVEAGEYITINGTCTVVAPFPSGNGLAQDNFHNRMRTAISLIQEIIIEY